MLIMVLGLVVSGPAAQAHTLTHDHNISAVLHVDPDDDPIIGQPANFYFDFTDKTKNLSFTNCDCQAVISQGRRVISTIPLSLSQLRPTIPGFTYTFPQKGIYAVVLTGRPKIPGEFQSFRLEYDLSITRQPGAPAKSDEEGHSWFHYFFDYGIAGAFAIAFGIMAARGKLTFQQKKKLERNPKY